MTARGGLVALTAQLSKDAERRRQRERAACAGVDVRGEGGAAAAE